MKFSAKKLRNKNIPESIICEVAKMLSGNHLFGKKDFVVIEKYYFDDEGFDFRLLCEGDDDLDDIILFAFLNRNITKVTYSEEINTYLLKYKGILPPVNDDILENWKNKIANHSI